MAEEKNLAKAEERQEPIEVKVESLIQIVRGKQVMFDRDLAELRRKFKVPNWNLERGTWQ